ncbi:uncharacterized protein LOC133896269 [Phragmites australis]|uniref:uncharacterized protein LOC133896269 n=1 Tax=Phragmites australis TaxID=29695 RepID=UPI002D78FBB3|nr:uncharacterized protein LOC133896269 [Phragmites australis]
MGCVPSKILAKSGSFQETVRHSFQRSNVIEEIILSSSKSNGDQFLALLCTSNSSVRKAKEPEQSPLPAAAEPAAKIETINVSELLAGLEEENAAEQERQSDRREGGMSPAQCASDGGAAGRARSFRTVEEFDALVTQSSSSEQATPAPEQEERRAAAVASSHGASATAMESNSSEQEEAARQGEATGAKRRARARQLGELKVPPAFDFSKSGSLRDWLLQGGQIFSPGSYVTPKFGTAPTAPADHEGHKAAEQQQQQQHVVFDPELVAQFERAMEQQSEDGERVLTEILEALELEAGEKERTAALGRVSDQPVAVSVHQD